MQSGTFYHLVHREQNGAVTGREQSKDSPSDLTSTTWAPSSPASPAKLLFKFSVHQRAQLFIRSDPFGSNRIWKHTDILRGQPSQVVKISRHTTQFKIYFFILYSCPWVYLSLYLPHCLLSCCFEIQPQFFFNILIFYIVGL